jgi:hypothetical protein
MKKGYRNVKVVFGGGEALERFSLAWNGKSYVQKPIR